MSDVWEDDDNDLDLDGSDLVKRLRRQLRKVTSERDALTDDLTKERAGNRTRSLADLLTSKGVNPKYATWFPGDREPTETSVAAWLEENRDLIPTTSKQPEGEVPPADDSGTAAPAPAGAQQGLDLSGLTPDAIAAMQRIASLGGVGATTPTVDSAKLAAVHEANSKAQTYEEFVALVNKII